MDEIPEDIQRGYMEAMAEMDAMYRDELGKKQPVPMCHFTPMEFHDCDSDPGGSGYMCNHCGHAEDPEEAWAKVERRVRRDPTLASPR